MKFLSSIYIKIVLVILVLGTSVFFLVAMPIIEDQINKVIQPPPYKASPKATELHKKLLISDLHGDSLLWGRDLLVKSNHGQIDIPRLLEGNVALQVFAVVTKTPHNLNIEKNDDKTDDIFWLSIVNGLPIKALKSLKERAIYHALRLHEISNNSQGTFVIVKYQNELKQFLEQKKQGKNIVAGLLAIEGAQVLEGKSSNVDVLFDAGYRMMSPTHFFDTEMGGSAHGIKKSGLTDNGNEMIRRMEEKRMIVDLAHASKETINDILKVAKRPVVVSHTGVKGTCDNNRNLSDNQLKAIAANGGLVGIGFWQTATCGKNANAIVKAIRYTVNLIGVNHVALGSDFDGAVTVPFDTTGLVLITEALLKNDFSEDDIAKIMGGNEIQFLLENLPENK